MIYEKGLNKEYHRVFQPLIKDSWLTGLPMLKSDRRKIKKHYSFYYEESLAKEVKLLNENLIEKFKYKYENHS